MPPLAAITIYGITFYKHEEFVTVRIGSFTSLWRNFVPLVFFVFQPNLMIFDNEQSVSAHSLRQFS